MAYRKSLKRKLVGWWGRVRGACLCPPGQVVRPEDRPWDEGLIEYGVIAEFAKCEGRLVWVDILQAYRGDDSVELAMDPPALMRVCRNQSVPNNLFRWMDGWCDPAYDVLPAERDERLDGLSGFFAYARSYHVSGGTNNPHFRVMQ